MTRAAPRPTSLGSVVLLAAALLAVSGCEIAEEVLAPAADVVVVEGLVQLRDDIDGQRVLVFLHRTVSGDRSVAVAGASVVVTRPDGSTLELFESPLAECVAAAPELEPAGTCYYVATDEGLGFAPGDRLELRVETAAGEVVTSATTVPTAHEIRNAPARGFCWIPPNTPLSISWTPSEGAWAYFAEALVFGLDVALEREGIEVDTDPFYLTGISVSASDTTIVLPTEFGVFDRASIDQEIAVRLQGGIPEGPLTEVAITATDRNYTNWVRGGNFNPSGQVRIPSVRGAGTGYFGSSVVKRLDVLSVDLLQPSSRCREPED